MVKPLLFKGDKKPKKRKRVDADLRDGDDTTPSSKALTTTAPQDPEEAEHDDSWVSAEVPTDIAGPIVFVLPTSPPSALSCDPTGKTFALELENHVEGDPATCEPHDVRQVWVANRVAGTENFSFKGHHGRYLGCDKFGVLSATNEAVGPEESFLLLQVPDSKGLLAVQTQRDKFVGVDQDEDEDVSKSRIRGDADDIKFANSLRVRMQARFKPRLKANKEKEAQSKISRKELEEAVGRRLDDDEVKMLKRARRRGDYHEVMLDLKVKGKHDKFA